MKHRRLLIIGALASMAILFGAWTVYARFGCRLHAIEFERPNGERWRTEDADFLRQVEGWRHSIEAPSLRQRWLRFTGRWIENGWRSPDYEVTLLFKDGHREEIAVWVFAKDYVPVYTARWSGSSGGHGYSCLAHSEPFTPFVQAMQRSKR
jgi:hypothetical protein